MSAHAGIHCFDGRPVTRDTLATLIAALAAYGPDGGREASPSPGVALVTRRLLITPEDSADHQPVELANGSWLTWDGRLDNRVDLMRELGLRGGDGMADAHVV